MVAFGQSFINVCINTREHRELLGWLGLPLGLGSLLLLRSGAQAISHAKCTSSNVDTAETACSLYYYIFSWPGCPTSQPVTASNPYLTANQSILSTRARSAVARSGQLCCHCPINKLSWIALLPLLWGQPAKLPGQPDTTAIHKTTVCCCKTIHVPTYCLPVIYTYHCH